MAEKEEYQSIVDGSDADFEIICTPCGEDKLREEAIKYCAECHEYLCTNCTRHHGRQKATKGHLLQDRNAAKQGLMVVKIKCRNHPDRHIEMYCKTHDMVYCALCIATEHRVCEGISKLESEATSRMNQDEVKQLIDEIKSAQNTFDTLKIIENDKLVSIEKQKNTIQEKVDGTEEKLVEHIRKLKMTTEKSLKCKYDTLTSTIASNVSQVSNTTKVLKKNEDDLKSFGNFGAEQQFVYMKLTKKDLTDAYKLHDAITSDGIQTLDLENNTELERVVLSADSLCHVIIGDEVRKGKKQLRVKSKREVNVKNYDDFTCAIVDICQLPDGQILLADCRNKKVKQLDTMYTLTNYCLVDTAPLSICCISRNEVAVKLERMKVQFISIGISSLTKTRVISISDGVLCGIAYFDNNLWVSRKNAIDIYKINGTLVKQIDYTQKDKPLFKHGYVQHMAVSGDMLVVANNFDGVICLNKGGNVIREFGDKRLIGTRGVCVAVDGTVFVTGSMTNNVLMFRRDGRCIGELIGSDSGMSPPGNVCYDQTNNNIIIGCENSNKIFIFELA